MLTFFRPCPQHRCLGGQSRAHQAGTAHVTTTKQIRRTVVSSDVLEAFEAETEALSHETEARRRDASRRPRDRDAETTSLVVTISVCLFIVCVSIILITCSFII